jgi:DNA-binding transcriptional ArsR family regulator
MMHFQRRIEILTDIVAWLKLNAATGSIDKPAISISKLAEAINVNRRDLLEVLRRENGVNNPTHLNSSSGRPIYVEVSVEDEKVLWPPEDKMKTTDTKPASALTKAKESSTAPATNSPSLLRSQKVILEIIRENPGCHLGFVWKKSNYGDSTVYKQIAALTEMGLIRKETSGRFCLLWPLNQPDPLGPVEKDEPHEDEPFPLPSEALPDPVDATPEIPPPNTSNDNRSNETLTPPPPPNSQSKPQDDLKLEGTQERISLLRLREQELIKQITMVRKAIQAEEEVLECKRSLEKARMDREKLYQNIGKDL